MQTDPRLKIAYIFMAYPVPTQPFAVSDVEALAEAGHEVTAYALRGPVSGGGHAAMIAEHELRLAPGSHPGLRTVLAAIDPRNLDILGFLLGEILRGGVLRPAALVKTLALVPRLVELGARMRRDPPDVLHAFWGHLPSLMVLLAARFFPGTHRSMFLGAYDLTSHFFALTPRAANIADSVWTHAEENVDVLIGKGVPAERITVARRGVPLDLDDDAPGEVSPGTIASAAFFQPEKNLDAVLRAFAELHSRQPETRLRLIGDGPERGRLEALAQTLGVPDAVVFTGHLSRRRLFAELRRADIFLFLSTKVSERLPNVVKEAMLAGCYPIVSRTSGIEDLVRVGETGEIADDLSASAVAARLRRALDDPGRREIGQAAAAHIRRQFSTAALMKPYAARWSVPRGPGGSASTMPVDHIEPTERRPTVTAIIPAYDRPDRLAGAVRSVLSQSYPIAEIIVVDDASPGELSGVAAMDPRVRYLRQPANAGANAARNAGLQAASSDLVAFLDDDDAWVPDKIARQVESLGDAEASLCGLSDKTTGKRQVQPVERVTEVMLRAGNPFCGMSGLVARRTALLAEPFDETLPSGQDWDVYVRLARRCPLAYVPDALFIRAYGGHDGITLSAQRETPEQLRARARVLDKHREWLGEGPYRVRLAGYLLKYVSRRPKALHHLGYALRRAGAIPTLVYLWRRVTGRDRVVAATRARGG